MPQKISEEKIKHMQIFRANGMTYEEIANILDVSVGTVSNYTKDTAILPENRQRNPFSRISIENSKKIAQARTAYPENRRIAEEIGDIEYFIQEHEEGTRFEGPLDKIEIKKLQQLMKEPTGYHSHLSIPEWADYYLGSEHGRFLKHPPHLWSPLQKEIMELWTEYPRIMIETFRGAGKTMAADLILTHEICENRDNNYAIMSEIKRKARKRVKHIGDSLLTNKRIIANYGFLPHITKYEGYTQSWTQEEITVKRDFKQTDPTLMCFSTDSAAATGAHYDGMVFDDVWSRKLEKNPRKNKQKFFDWFEGELEGCLEDAWELWLLTRKSVNDLYKDLEDSKLYVTFKKPAVIKFPSKFDYKYKKIGVDKVFDHVEIHSNDWDISAIVPKFQNTKKPKLESMKFFLTKKLKMERPKWMSEYQLDPIAEQGKFWSWKNLRFISGWNDFYNMLNNEKKRKKYMKIIGFMDLGFGKSMRADYTALVILGSYENKFYLLETYLKRGASENDLVRMLRQAQKTFPLLRTVYIEEDLQQTDKVHRIKQKAPFMSIQPFLSRQEQNRIKREDSAKRSDLSGKLLRIWAQLEGIIEDNKLYINKNMSNFREFKDEFISFPDCDHYDVLDALGNGTSKLTTKAAVITALSTGGGWYPF